MKKSCNRHEHTGMAIPGCNACENIRRAYLEHEQARMGEPVDITTVKPRSRLSVFGGYVGASWIYFCRGLAVIISLPLSLLKAILQSRSVIPFCMAGACFFVLGALFEADTSGTSPPQERKVDPMKAPGCHFLKAHYNPSSGQHTTELYIYERDEDDRHLADFDSPERAMRFLKDNHLKFCEQVP